jgi:WD40 repeat protein
VRSAVFSPDGIHVATVSKDKSARIRDSMSKRQIAVLDDSGKWVQSAAYSPDGGRIVTTFNDDKDAD